MIGQLGTGGVELRLVWTMRALGDSYEHLVVSLDGSTDVLDAAPDLEERMRVLQVPQQGSTLRTVRWIRGTIIDEQPDALLSYGWGGFDAVLASLLPRSRVPCFHHEDGFTAEDLAHMPLRRTLARRLCLPRIAATIVPSRGLVDHAKQAWKVPLDRIVHVPNGVPRAADDDRVNVRERFGLPDHTALAVVVGRLAAVKRVDLAIDAAHGAGVPLVVIGDGPQRSALERQRTQLDSKTYFAGHQANPRAWLRGCDIYLSTSASEQHPLAMLEAMDEGLPVVATDVGDVAVSLPDAQKAFLAAPAGAASKAATLLASLAEQPALRASLGASNRSHVDQLFRLETAVKATEDVIRVRCRAKPFGQ